MPTSFFYKTADEPFTAGPEILVARSSTVAVGRVTAYARQIVSTSLPPGPDAIPLGWIVNGRMDNPKALKGSISGPLTFSRAEQSPLLAGDRNRERWEMAYRDLDATALAVLFLSGEAHAAIKAIPSGVGERDLASLVRDIVAIQNRPATEAQAAWLSYLQAAPLEQGRKAALRTLVREQMPWPQLQPPLERLMGGASLSDDQREFSFGIVVFGLTQDHWQAHQLAVGEFLCRQFDSETGPDLLLSYILSLKLAILYTTEEAEARVRAPVRNRIVECLQRRESAASMVPELAEQYRELRADYPRLF